MKLILISLLMIPSFAFGSTIFEPRVGLTAGASTGSATIPSQVTPNTSITVDGAENSYAAFNAGFQYGIRRKYVHATAILDAYYLAGTQTINGASESNSSFKFGVGFGLGWEWNIPLRTTLIIGVPVIDDNVTQGGIELSYMFNEKFLLGLRYMTISSKFDSDDEAMDVSTVGLTVSIPFEFDYPSYWWRKKEWE